ncbi:hypothetical protein NUW54_g12878 [Trametes sanguinea]|uniref:Uncharacterized protein n=1 Tax=Trametes sanguinea TaxID=158606 RepID=A0ACC1MRZ8_9APHY|nr:hypothetical protein NUW54_g12878 [Trametes sanguinea]
MTGDIWRYLVLLPGSPENWRSALRAQGAGCGERSASSSPSLSFPASSSLSHIPDTAAAAHRPLTMSAAAIPEAVSSSSTLWATASKEWVIPAKPKPGRKPKKDVAPPPQDAAENDKGRRVQNRAAQRAFRERKQSQLAELQARLQQYEQGEIERNVALQNIAKRLKEENEKLRQENAALKAKVTQYEERAAQKRARDEASSYDISQSPAKKRNKVTTEALNNLNQMTFPP